MADIADELMELATAILMVTMIEGDSILSYSYREDFDPLNETRQRVMAVETSIIMALLKKNHDLLGEVDFVLIRQKAADLFFFPIRNRPKRTLCVAVERPYDYDSFLKDAKAIVDARF